MSVSPQQRRRLWQDFRTLGKTLRLLQRSKPMVRGSLYLLQRKCGKKSCRCNRGELHPCWVMTRSEEGKIRLYAIPKEQRGRLKKLTGVYRRHQQSRARMIQLFAQLLRQVDAITEQRMEQWPQGAPRSATRNEP